MRGKSDQQTTPDAAPNDAFKQFEAAFLEYFKDVNTIAFEAAENVRRMQVEYERDMREATDEKSARTIFEKFQKQVAESGEKLSPAAAYVLAYEKYTGAMGRAFSGANAADLDPATITALGQSLAIVASHAAATFSYPPRKSDDGLT
jgi:hypothetical protein